MATKCIYVCDRCGREEESVGRGTMIFHSEHLYKRSKSDLCGKCATQFGLFLRNERAATTYIVEPMP